MRTLARLMLAALAALAGCSGGGGRGVVTATVTPNPNMSMSVIVSYSARGAARARVISIAGRERLVSPYRMVPPNGLGQISILGLTPQTVYEHTLEVDYGNGGAASMPVSASTDMPPPAVAPLQMVVTAGTGRPDPSGYYLVSGAGMQPFATDASGTVRWYRDFASASQETKMHVDGTFTTYVGAGTGWQPIPGEFVRYTADGTELARYSATSPDPTEDGAPPLYTDGHELLITEEADGTERFHLFAVCERTVSPTDPRPAAWHELLRQTADGTVELRWKSWEYFTAAESTETVTPPAIDIDHANALAIDPTDGNYIASFRDTDTVLKIDYNTGAVLWQLGGKRSQFAFVGDPGFQGQHSVQALPNGNVLLYDNGLAHTPPESRAVEYALDVGAMTATPVWQFRHPTPVFTPVTGSVERLKTGNTLVAFAWKGLVNEVDPQGNIVWEGQLLANGKALASYRIRHQASLYEDLDP